MSSLYPSNTTPDVPLIKPVLVLAAWTFVMQAWLYGYRIPDIGRYKVDAKPGMTKEDMNSKIPRHRQYPADNFAHLHEQPTVFYAVALSLALLNVKDTMSLRMAWAYVGVRVVHSLVQSTSNVIMRRFGLFMLSSGILAGLTVRGLMEAF